jgi:hypothetical protein
MMPMTVLYLAINQAELFCIASPNNEYDKRGKHLQKEPNFRRGDQLIASLFIYPLTSIEVLLRSGSGFSNNLWQS